MPHADAVEIHQLQVHLHILQAVTHIAGALKTGTRCDVEQNVARIVVHIVHPVLVHHCGTPANLAAELLGAVKLARE